MRPSRSAAAWARCGMEGRGGQGVCRSRAGLAEFGKTCLRPATSERLVFVEHRPFGAHLRGSTFQWPPRPVRRAPLHWRCTFVRHVLGASPDLKAAVEYFVLVPADHQVCEVMSNAQGWYAQKVQHNPGHGLGQPDFHSWTALVTLTALERPAPHIQATLTACAEGVHNFDEFAGSIAAFAPKPMWPWRMKLW